MNKPESLEHTQHGGNHYKDLVIEPAEYAHKNKLGFLEGSAVKYITRHGSKGGAEDLKKAIHFCQMVLEMSYQVTSTVNFHHDQEVAEKLLQDLRDSKVSRCC